MRQHDYRGILYVLLQPYKHFFFFCLKLIWIARRVRTTLKPFQQALRLSLRCRRPSQHSNTLIYSLRAKRYICQVLLWLSHIRPDSSETIGTTEDNKEATNSHSSEGVSGRKSGMLGGMFVHVWKVCMLLMGGRAVGITHPCHRISLDVQPKNNEEPTY